MKFDKEKLRKRIIKFNKKTRNVFMKFNSRVQTDIEKIQKKISPVLTHPQIIITTKKTKHIGIRLAIKVCDIMIVRKKEKQQENFFKRFYDM